MKKSIFKILTVAAAIVLGASCEDNIRQELATPEDQMHLAVSKELVEVSFFDSASDAVTFTWETSGYENQGTECTYWFKMDVAGNGFETSISKINVTGSNSVTFRGDELKSFFDSWKILDGTTIKVEAEVIAQPVEKGSVQNQKYQKPEVSKAEFDLVCSSDVTMIIDGKEYPFATNGIFAVVEAGIYKCTTGTTISYDVTVPDKGLWIFLLDYSSHSVKALRPQLWILGDATSNGWLLSTMPEFDANEDGSVKTWKGFLNPGELKFPLEQNFNWNFNIAYLMPSENGTPAGEGDCTLVLSGVPDNKWRVEKMGEYEIQVDMQEMKVKFTLIKEFQLKWSDIWMVGNATTGGWESNPFQIKLTYDSSNGIKGYPGVFYFDGPLTEGEFKFPLEERTFEVPYLMPVNVGSDGLQQLPGDGETCDIEYVERYGSDHKWKVSAEQAGDYRLIIDTDKMTMTVNRK